MLRMFRYALPGMGQRHPRRKRICRQDALFVTQYAFGRRWLVASLICHTLILQACGDTEEASLPSQAPDDTPTVVMTQDASVGGAAPRPGVDMPTMGLPPAQPNRDGPHVVVRPSPPTSEGIDPSTFIDTDGDGVPDVADRCPDTLAGSTVDAAGCSSSQLVSQLPQATYAYNVEAEMVVQYPKRSYPVVLVLEPDLAVAADAVEAAVVEVLKAHDAVMIEDQVESRRAPYAESMSAELSGPEDWEIVPSADSSGIRLISGRTTWRWIVTPACPEPTFSLECGKQTLSLAVFAHLGGDARQDWLLWDKDIVVHVTLDKFVTGFFGEKWKWLWTALLIPIILYFLKRFWERRHKETRRKKTKILFLAANPVNMQPLHLDEEVRAIQGAIRKADYRDQFDVEQHWAVRGSELDDFLLQHQPDIVHFSGHGSKANELMVKRADNTGSEAVATDMLDRLFAALKDNVRLVVLNACYSEVQAAAIARHVDCVVGMSRAISDGAATKFAEALYQALAYGRDVKTAFDLACNEAGEAALTAEKTPRLKAERVDPSSIAFVTKEKSDG